MLNAYKWAEYETNNREKMLFYKLHLHCWSSLERNEHIEHELFNKPPWRSPHQGVEQGKIHTQNRYKPCSLPTANIWCCDNGHTNRTETDILLWKTTQVSRPVPKQNHQQSKSHPITFLRGKKKNTYISTLYLPCGAHMLPCRKLCAFLTHTQILLHLTVSELLACIWWSGNKAPTNGRLLSKLVDSFVDSVIVPPSSVLQTAGSYCLCVDNAMTFFLCSPPSFPKVTQMDTHNFCMLCSTDPSGMSVFASISTEEAVGFSTAFMELGAQRLHFSSTTVVIHKHFTIRKPRPWCTDTRALVSPPGNMRTMITASSFLF